MLCKIRIHPALKVSPAVSKAKSHDRRRRDVWVENNFFELNAKASKYISINYQRFNADLYKLKMVEQELDFMPNRTKREKTAYDADASAEKAFSARNFASSPPP